MLRIRSARKAEYIRKRKEDPEEEQDDTDADSKFDMSTSIWG